MFVVFSKDHGEASMLFPIIENMPLFESLGNLDQKKIFKAWRQSCRLNYLLCDYLILKKNDMNIFCEKKFFFGYSLNIEQTESHHHSAVNVLSRKTK